MKRVIGYLLLILIVLGAIGFLALGLFTPEATRQPVETVIPNERFAPR